MFYENLFILNSFLNHKKFDVIKLWFGCTPIVVGIKNCRFIVTINFQWSFNAIDHTQANDKISQPYPMVGFLKISYELCDHGWRSYGSLFSILPRDNSSSQHEYVSICGTFVVLTSNKIRVWVPNDLQILKLLISEHISFCSLQVTHHTFACFPMLQSRITQISAWNSYYKYYIGMSANLSVH